MAEMRGKTNKNVKSQLNKSPKKVNKKRQTKWKDDDVNELISLMQEETVIFSLYNAKTPKEKSACYQIVHAELNKKGINCSLDAVINKWKKLKQQYKDYLDKSRRSGTEKRKKWKFFDEMDKACGNRDTSTPVCMLDSSRTNDCSDLESDSSNTKLSEAESINRFPEHVSNLSHDNEEDKQEDDFDFTGMMEEETLADVIEEMEREDGGENDGEEKDGEEKDGEEKDDGKKEEVSLKMLKKKTPKKTKLEKSIEVLSNGFCAAAEKESEMMIRLEKMRHKEMLEHEIRLKELENERRREERQHELLLLNLLSQNRSQVNPQDVLLSQNRNHIAPQDVLVGQHMMYGSNPVGQVHPTTSASNQHETYTTYFKL